METNCSNSSNLNDFFKAIGQMNEDESDWKHYTDQILIPKFQILSSYIRNLYNLPIDIRVFGSSIEGLKCYLPNDIGDIDVMVFSTADEVTIPESIVEVHSAENSVFVRIRGEEHPVFQHCLAENSSFVSTCTLKDFHPRVFGDARALLKFIPKLMTNFNFVDQIRSSVTQERDSPSIQWNFSQFPETFAEQYKNMKGSDYKFGEDMKGLMEWLAVSLNPGKPFTHEHSVVMEEYIRYVQDCFGTFSENPSTQTFRGFQNQLLFGGKIQELSKKYQEVQISNEQSAEETTSSESGDDNRGDGIKEELKNQKTYRDSSAESNERTCRRDIDSHEVVHEAEDCSVGAIDLEGQESDRLAKVSPVQDMEKVIREISMKYKELRCQNSDKHSAEETATNSEPEDDNKEDGIKEAKSREDIEKDIMRHFLEHEGFFSYRESVEDEILQSSNRAVQGGGIDIVPAFLATGWPQQAHAWITRDRKWPSQDFISKILQNGFHLVVKAPQESGTPDLDFRLSFSHAEFVLSEELNDIQRECYRCIKLYYKSSFQNKFPHVLTSYFLKTILFWAVEGTGMEFWTAGNRAECVLMLLGKLQHSLETKCLQHFFVLEFNLLEDAVKVFPHKVESLAAEVAKICKDPMSYRSNEMSDETPKNKGPNSDPCGTPDETVNQSKDSPIRRFSIEHIGTASGERTSSAPAIQQDDDALVLATTVPPPQTAGQTPHFLRYCDFQILYREVCREMLDLAMQNDVDSEDPTIRSIVDNMRQVIDKITSPNPENEMMTVIETGENMTYSTSMLSRGDSKRRILAALKGQWEMHAYVARQDDLMSPGNEQLIIDRMLRSPGDGSADAFDVNALFPEGGDWLRQVFMVADNQFSQVGPDSVIEDDIPLD